MSLTKADIVDLMNDRLGLPKNQSSELVEALLDIIKNTLASGNDVLISRFSKFQVNKKRERKGRNPATGGDMMLEASRVVTFKWSGSLKDRINGK